MLSLITRALFTSLMLVTILLSWKVKLSKTFPFFGRELIFRSLLAMVNFLKMSFGWVLQLWSTNNATAVHHLLETRKWLSQIHSYWPQSNTQSGKTRILIRLGEYFVKPTCSVIQYSIIWFHEIFLKRKICKNMSFRFLHRAAWTQLLFTL